MGYRPSDNRHSGCGCLCPVQPCNKHELGNGKFLEQWNDFIAKPRGALYITSDDTLYVSHVDAEAISVVKNGKVVEVIRGVGARPHGMTLDRAGNIYVTFPLTSGVKKIVKK